MNYGECTRLTKSWIVKHWIRPLHFMPRRRRLVPNPKVKGETLVELQIVLKEQGRVRRPVVLVLARALVKSTERPSRKSAIAFR